MGYKKLDEVMELLTDELDGFNKSIGRLEELTKNTEIKIKPDTSSIEHLLNTYLKASMQLHSENKDSIRKLENELSKSKLVSKFWLWLQYSIWLISLIIIGYLVTQV